MKQINLDKGKKFEDLLLNIIEMSSNSCSLNIAEFTGRIRVRIPLWAVIIGETSHSLLKAMEDSRTTSVSHWYSDYRLPFPDTENLTVYATLDEFKSICKSQTFRCPSCGQLSVEPFFCEVKSTKLYCNWKAYGYSGCLGRGHRFVIKADLIQTPKVPEIFMPFDLEDSCGQQTHKLI
ncbi:hypothetical protein Sps_00555 [Shewanella psychrophila]|uniref:Uncharacterized protein n=1 Tax=Shewanella psychrophila TaxID=225848 RepID=A0A1S6HJS1_9GAMM|nr:hypothetical protein [Shewanella psychrophila]AQS35753.1 hypothetical protein Sps_00555 [Shewanella psychrophila]